MRSITFLAMAMLGAWWPTDARGQTTHELDWIVNTMARLCVIGGDRITVRATGRGDADLMLQSISKGGKLEGEFQIDRSRSEGLVGGITSALSKVEAEQASEVRRCLEPLRSRLLQVSLPAAASPGASQPAVARDSRPPAAEMPPAAARPPMPAAPPPLPRSSRPASPAPVEHAAGTAYWFNPGGINESSEGFACRKSAMPMDYVICTFQEVYDINTQHAVAWWATMTKLDRAKKDALIQDQRAWLSRMIRSCGLPPRGKPTPAQMVASAPCVRESYLERVKYVRQYGSA